MPFVRELDEVRYQFKRPFVLDSRAAQETFGLTPTPMEEGLAAHVRWWTQPQKEAGGVAVAPERSRRSRRCERLTRPQVRRRTTMPTDQPDLIVERYLRRLGGGRPDPAALTFYASLDQMRSVDPLVADRVVAELVDQRTHLKLIASENYASLAVLLAMGNLLTDKYAEGAPGHRFYAGCDNVDAIESHGAELANALFGAEHAYVQPHSGIDANLVAFWRSSPRGWRPPSSGSR